ncbi:MAG: hypothetical protein KAT34_10550 [Candidatus Aminicenantes bacterium]|nr:hypothetical protein [Candidatus Aminicenantes bacterium]
MITGVNIYETRDYVSKDDPDKEKPTIFKIGLLDSQMKSHILDKVSDFELSSDNPDDDTKINYRTNERNLSLVKFGVKDIENLLDPQTAEPIKIKPDTVNRFGKSYEILPDRILNMLRLKIITELALEILKEVNITKEAEKN